MIRHDLVKPRAFGPPLLITTLLVTCTATAQVPTPPAAQPAVELPAPTPLPEVPGAQPSPSAPSPLPPPDAPPPDLGGRAGGGMFQMFSPVVGHMLPRADYRFTWFPEEPVRGQPTNLGYFQQDFSASLPVWQDCADEFSLTTHLRAEVFQTSAILPDTDQPFPHELWNIHFGGSYRHLFDNGWIAGGSVSVGSASNKPFHSIEEMTAGVNAFLRLPRGEHEAWLFTLSYSPTSELPIPIPGVAYLYQPSPEFRAVLGLPLMLMYRPMDDLTLDFSYMLIRTVHAAATYRLCPPVRIYLAYDWSNESYFLVPRLSDDDRLFYYDMRLTTGLRAVLGPHAAIDFAGGYVFDRFYFEGQHFSDNHLNRVDVGNGPFIGLRAEFRY
jgi:hypothetical protein